MNSSLQTRKTRFVAGGETEVSAEGNIEWWERKVLVSAEDDQAYVIDKKFEGRLDLIAALFLGESRYWWVLAQYNSILDPYAEITEGSTIYIPSKERVDQILSGGRLGGVPTTREVQPSILPIV